MTVEHGPNGLACKMGIRPRQSLFLEEPPPGGLTPPKAMSAGEVTAIVDEVVPPGTRGRELDQMNFQSSCIQSELTSYANVRIDRVTACNPDGRGVENVDIAFEPGHCPAASLKLSEFRLRYGEPNAEVFLVRPGISLDVEYGSDGGACNMRIDTHGHDLAMRNAIEILDEAVPSSVKGKLISPMMNIHAGRCGGFGSERYENVRFSLSASGCPDHVDRASAAFTRAICRNLPW